MLPKEHFIYAIVPAIIISFYNPIYALLFLASTILIDIDHYAAFVSSFKKYNLKAAAKFYTNDLYHYLLKHKVKVFLLFHNIETFIILLLLSAFFPSIYPVFFGVSFHYLLDLCRDYITNKRFVREESAILYLFKRKKFSLKEVT